MGVGPKVVLREILILIDAIIQEIEMGWKTQKILKKFTTGDLILL